MADNYLRVCRLTSGGKTYSWRICRSNSLSGKSGYPRPPSRKFGCSTSPRRRRTQSAGQNQSIVLEAGYRDHYGAIFKGTIKQGNRGKVNGTDTFVDLFCGDGDQAYIKGQVIKTLPKGSTRQDVVNDASRRSSPTASLKASCLQSSTMASNIRRPCRCSGWLGTSCARSRPMSGRIGPSTRAS